jgi:hypothetical protein
MRRIVIGFAVLGGVLTATGCQYMHATTSVQGRAYMVRNAFVTSDFWNCDATSGEPVCYQTNRVVLPAGTNK